MFQDSMKNRRMKALAAVLAAVLVLSMLLVGCSGGTEGAGEGEPERETHGNKVKAPVEMNIFVQNNIQTSTLNVEKDEGKRNGSYLKVAGLLDVDVETKINEKIYNTFEEALSGDKIPAYRGIKVELDENTTPSSVFVNAYPNANINNVLSILMVRSVNFATENTGDEITLSDMFADNVDYMEYINDIVKEKLAAGNADEEDYFSYPDDDIKLAGTFESIKADQKFYLNEYSGSISLVLDYDTPEFYTAYYPTTLTIENSDKMAFTKRFYDGDCIFTNDAIAYSLPSKDYDGSKLVSKRDYTTPLGEDVSFNVYNEARYFSDMPKPLLNIAKQYSKGSSSFSSEAEAIYNEYAGEYGAENVSGIYGYNLYVQRIGDYTYINSSQYIDMSQKPEYKSLYNFYTDTYRCYKGDKDKMLELEDIFKEDVDYAELIKQAFLKNIDTYDGGDEVDWTNAEEAIDSIMENMTGFYVGQNALYFSYANANGAVMSVIDDPNQSSRYTSICSNASYRNLGCENLTIFE